MNIKEAKKILKNDYSKFLELPIDIRDDNSIKDLALHEAMKQEKDEWGWQYFLLDKEKDQSRLFDKNKELDTSNNDKYMTLKIAEVTNNNVVYMGALSDDLRNDKEFFEKLYKVRPQNFSWGYLEYGSKKIQSDFDFALNAIEKNIKDFEHVDPSLLKNLEFLAKSLNINPDLILKKNYSEEVLKDKKFVKHLNKKNNISIQEHLDSNKFIKDIHDTDEPLDEEEGKIFLLYILCWFFFSQYQNNNEPFKLTPEIKEKTIYFFEICNLKNIPLLKNAPSYFFEINQKNEILRGAMSFIKNDKMPTSLIGNLPLVAIFKSFNIGIELLAMSSFVSDNDLSHLELMQEKVVKDIGITTPDFDLFGISERENSRWIKVVATLFLSDLAAWAFVLDENNKGIHYYNAYILNLIRNKFQSNKFIYTTKYKENFPLSVDFIEEEETALTCLGEIISVNDCSLLKYRKINEHFETSLETYADGLDSNNSILREITNFLIQEYGLVMNFQGNQEMGSRKEMLRFFSFESSSSISNDFLCFIQKDKEWLCGINSESFKIPYQDTDEDDYDQEEEVNRNVKFKTHGYQPINPSNLSNGYLVKVEELDFWKEINFDVALTVNNKKVNKEKEFIFLDKQKSMDSLISLGNFFVDTMKKVNKGEGVSLTQSEGMLLKKGELYSKNLDKGSGNIRLLDQSSELIYSINSCLPSEILYNLKQGEDVEEIATYKFSAELFTIDEDMWGTIIKIIIVKYKSGSCEGLAIPFFQR
tara:strand:- start:605 stop:2875 length:2271 start_codon:yes stop_codon:yes gene_type:complete